MTALLLPVTKTKFARATRSDKRTVRCDINTKGGTYLKELVKEGTFVDGQGRTQTFTRADLRTWTFETNRYIDNGNLPAMPIEHTKDPEQNRGSVLRVKLAKNRKGEWAIFGICKFRDAEAEKMATSVDCSVFVEPNYVDGKGNKYKAVITHLALTNYPVVSGLEGFDYIQLSLSKGKPKMASEALLALAKSMKIRTMANDDDATLSKRITKRHAQMSAKLAAFKKPGADDEETDDEETDDKKPFAKKKPVASGKKKVAASRTPAPATVPGAMLGLLRDNRKLKLSKLVDDGKISPAQEKKLVKQYCDDASLTIACSKTGADTDFDSMISILEENTVALSLEGSKTGAQAIRLSQETVDEIKAHRDADIEARKARHA